MSAFTTPKRSPKRTLNALMETGVHNFTSSFSASEEVKQTFDEYGYILVRGLLSKDELKKLKTALENDEGVLTKSHTVSIIDGKETRMCLWNHPGNDITGMLARCEKVATTMEMLLGGEVYHYHTKLMMKEGNGGGQFVWHQDYGYWYNNGCLYPYMGTVFIAIDSCKKSNGCLQIIPGSHKLGRIDHKNIGGQMGADPERVNYVLANKKSEMVEMDPGDALFFHCNLLHKSEENTSAARRWAFLIAYNRASNNPVKKHHLPRYVKLEKVPDSAIYDCDTTTDLRNKGFIKQFPEDRSKVIVEDEHLN